MYLLVLATGGLFSVVWLLLMLRDSDVAIGRRGSWTVLSVAFLGGFVLHIILLVLIINFPPGSAMREAILIPDVVLALTLVVLEIASVVVINNRIHLAIGSTSSIRDTILMVILTFVMLVSLVVLQRRLNGLTERSSAPR